MIPVPPSARGQMQKCAAITVDHGPAALQCSRGYSYSEMHTRTGLASFPSATCGPQRAERPSLFEFRHMMLVKGCSPFQSPKLKQGLATLVASLGRISSESPNCSYLIAPLKIVFSALRTP